MVNALASAPTAKAPLRSLRLRLALDTRVSIGPPFSLCNREVYFDKSFYLAKYLCLFPIKNFTPLYMHRRYSNVYFLQMADLSRDDVLKLAQLARLDLSDDEIEEYSRELTEILHYVEQLQGVDINGLNPTNQVTGLTNVTRKDEVKDYGYNSKDLLKNLPAIEAEQIKVKRMIG